MPSNRTDERLKQLVDSDMVRTNAALYHAQVAQLRQWLTMTEMALRDEGLDEETTQRVLDRMVYGTPNPHDARIRRIDGAREVHNLMERSSLADDQLYINCPKHGRQARDPFTHKCVIC